MTSEWVQTAYKNYESTKQNTAPAVCEGGAGQKGASVSESADGFATRKDANTASPKAAASPVAGDDLRIAFEKWADSEGQPIERHRAGYRDEQCDILFNGFIAGWEARTPPTPPSDEEVER